MEDQVKKQLKGNIYKFEYWEEYPNYWNNQEKEEIDAEMSEKFREAVSILSTGYDNIKKLVDNRDSSGLDKILKDIRLEIEEMDYAEELLNEWEVYNNPDEND